MAAQSNYQTAANLSCHKMCQHDSDSELDNGAFMCCVGLKDENIARHRVP